jgi:hypothetical protein
LNVLTGGTWINVLSDPAPNVYSLNFNVDGSSVGVDMSGLCDELSEQPTVCNWDPTSGDASRWVTDHEITAVVSRPFGIKTITVKYLPANQLKITTVTHFTDESGLPDYTTVETFQKYS